MPYSYLLLWLLLRSPGILSLTLEAKGNHLADIYTHTHTHTHTQICCLQRVQKSNLCHSPREFISWWQSGETDKRHPTIRTIEKEKHYWQSNDCWYDKKKNLWFGPNKNLVPPEILKSPLLIAVHALNHWSRDKMMAFMNQYWRRNINKAAESAHFACPTCTKYNPGKPVLTASGHFKLPIGPFGVWQMDFIQIPLLHDTNVSWWWFLCSPTWLKLFHLDKLLPLQ